MEYESKPERLSGNPSHKRTGKRLPQEKQDKIVDMLKSGNGTTEIQRETGISKPTIISMRENLESSGEFKLGTWKKNTSALMSQIVTMGSERLLEEIDDIPVGQLPLAIAIMTDKVLALHDAPTVVVEHRLRVSHEDINSMLKGDVVDVPEIKT